MLSEERKKLIRTILTALAIGCVGFFGLAWLLIPIFSGKFVLPQNLSLGGFRIQYYGIVLALAVLAGYWLARKRRDKVGITEDESDNIVFWVLASGFIGARAYHVISELPYYLEQPLQIFAVWRGGLSIFGAALGGLLALYVYHRRSVNKFNFLQLLDWLAPSLVLGQIIGRFGNFLNYELYGLPTDLPWKMFVPPSHRAPPFEMNQFFHPLFLYEAAGSAVILYLLLKLRLRSGQLFLLWLFLYNGMRFSLEFLRANSVTYSGIRVNAIVALALSAAAIFIWYRLRDRAKNAIPHPPNN